MILISDLLLDKFSMLPQLKSNLSFFYRVKIVRQNTIIMWEETYFDENCKLQLFSNVQKDILEGVRIKS